jgi:predicted GH43/DUF377 family glycosyl hydrolase
MKSPENISLEEKYAYYETPENTSKYIYGVRGGWKKYEHNPVFGGEYGVCFDVSMMEEKGLYKMWFSWRTKVSLGYCESKDGIHWSNPVVVLSPVENSSWEADELNRPSVLKVGNCYKMWYSGQMQPYMEDGRSVIGYVESADGINWQRIGSKPVLEPGGEWEQHSIMCPHVLYDVKSGLYKMWYSGGSNHEPDAIGYAVSKDGIHWEKYPQNPMFTCVPENLWEQYKVCACQVLEYKGYYYMFYIGHMHEERASVGIARSKDGITNWERFKENPIIAPDKGTWDDLSVYKPFVLRSGRRWMLWYNGAKYDSKLWAIEKIGLAYLDADNFGF